MLHLAILLPSADIVDYQVVKATEGPKIVDEVISKSQFAEMKVAYPMVKEELTDFLNCCRLKNYEVMVFPGAALSSRKRTPKA